ncbi:TetR/AcrR family transcriptional regulator [Sporosarcina limicola]|uniref:AcrR family transcriptional regulator n=1 Tax=Sporosarcina limicola TaxID=34101 RepID=A0A927R8A1_9BACL|nr:TetR/AcrR family transcriptional regulator [Sporosarcina limicola]MBE1556799.1 AcrR family transcriptional regulator [Sporosarcina limicola]
MARNKYPEVTLEKILDVAQRLFLEKGFDQTTIQDIVDGLDGLTRGAVYHHFKSKDEIMDALINKMFLDNNPFDTVKGRKDLNGLQKMRMAIMLNQSNHENMDMSVQSIPILKNPRILAGIIESNRQLLSPSFFELIEEGNKDGSIDTKYAKELSELIPLLELWLMPSIYPADAEEMYRKFSFIHELLNHMGLPLFDEEMIRMIKQSFSVIEKMD